MNRWEKQKTNRIEQKKQKTKNKMGDLNSFVLIITIYVNSLNNLVKRQRLSE